MKWLLYIALLISIITYQIWNILPKGYWYYGNAIFVLLISLYLYLQEKKSFVKFVIVELSFANFINELFFDTSVLTLEEALLIVIIPFIWFIKYDNNFRLLERNKCNGWRTWYVSIWKKIDKDPGEEK